MGFKMRFDKSKISYWANRYSYDDDELESEIGPTVRDRGYYKYAELKTLCQWKAPRSAGHCEKNEPEYVETVTRAALSSTNEQFRIQALTVLEGVNWPTASVMLHFGSNGRYPVLDKRALWSVRAPKRPYKFGLWWDYTEFCRARADESGVSMRILDRALWQFSKENQGKASKTTKYTASGRARSFRVNGKIRYVRQYRDGTDAFEIHVNKLGAQSLPYKEGQRVEIHLMIGTKTYFAGLRATARCPYIWISPDLWDQYGEKTRLVDALHGYRRNQSVDLFVDAKHIRVG